MASTVFIPRIPQLFRACHRHRVNQPPPATPARCGLRSSCTPLLPYSLVCCAPHFHLLPFSPPRTDSCVNTALSLSHLSVRYALARLPQSKERNETSTKRRGEAREALLCLRGVCEMLFLPFHIPSLCLSFLLSPTLSLSLSAFSLSLAYDHPLILLPLSSISSSSFSALSSSSSFSIALLFFQLFLPLSIFFLSPLFVFLPPLVPSLSPLSLPPLSPSPCLLHNVSVCHLGSGQCPLTQGESKLLPAFSASPDLPEQLLSLRYCQYGGLRIQIHCHARCQRENRGTVSSMETQRLLIISICGETGYHVKRVLNENHEEFKTG